MTFDGPLLKGRWRLGPRMGAGSQAKTYLARDVKAPGERVVVVKQLSLAGASSWKKFDLFEREARVLKSLDHPGIPRYIDHFESDAGTFNLVLERAPGASLRAIATRYRFTDADLRDVLRGVAEILDYLHALRPPVIHRDLKPANLVRAADGSIRLVDFGGVRDVLRDGGGSTVIGTFGYMAPEQLHGEATPATDLYGLGATVVALATGLEPDKVERRGLEMNLRAHLRDMDPGLLEILEAMTAPDPGDRPQSAREVIRMLDDAPPPRGARNLALARRERKTPLSGPVADPLADVPEPLRGITRLLLAIVGTAGYVGLTVIHSALLPLVFALIGAFASDSSKPKLASARAKLGGALGEGREAFRDLQARSRRPERALPARELEALPEPAAAPDRRHRSGKRRVSRSPRRRRSRRG